jgi:NAD(P) transhydrogenase subunit alpha
MLIHLFLSIAVGTTDLISRMAWQASSMYSNNMCNLMELLCPKPREGEHISLKLDFDDTIIRAMTCVKEGSITWPPPEDVTKTSAHPKAAGAESAKLEALKQKKESIVSKRILDMTTVGELLLLIFSFAFMGIVAAYAPVTFVSQLLYFILAGFLGYFLIWNVEPALFSPLMSTSNSLSGVVILGGILMASTARGSATNILGCSAIAVASVNVFGGFAVSVSSFSLRRMQTFVRCLESLNDIFAYPRSCYSTVCFSCSRRRRLRFSIQTRLQFW